MHQFPNVLRYCKSHSRRSILWGGAYLLEIIRKDLVIYCVVVKRQLSLARVGDFSDKIKSMGILPDVMIKQ